jgi:hypothetical protein
MVVKIINGILNLLCERHTFFMGDHLSCQHLKGNS